MRHEHETQLRWSDAEMLGHLNHARLLGLIEDARLADAFCVMFDYDAESWRPISDEERQFWSTYLEEAA